MIFVVFFPPQKLLKKKTHHCRWLQIWGSCVVPIWFSWKIKWIPVMDQSQLTRCWKTGLVPISEHRLTGPALGETPCFSSFFAWNWNLDTSVPYCRTCKYTHILFCMFFLINIPRAHMKHPCLKVLPKKACLLQPKQRCSKMSPANHPNMFLQPKEWCSTASRRRYAPCRNDISPSGFPS